MSALIRRSSIVAVLATVLLTGIAAPAGALAPQPIDATEQGPLAFVAMAGMIVIFAFSLFYMDRIRKRAIDNDDQHQS